MFLCIWDLWCRKCKDSIQPFKMHLVFARWLLSWQIKGPGPNKNRPSPPLKENNELSQLVVWLSSCQQNIWKRISWVERSGEKSYSYWNNSIVQWKYHDNNCEVYTQTSSISLAEQGPPEHRVCGWTPSHLRYISLWFYPSTDGVSNNQQVPGWTKSDPVHFMSIHLCKLQVRDWSRGFWVASWSRVRMNTSLVICTWQSSERQVGEALAIWVPNARN